MSIRFCNNRGKGSPITSKGWREWQDFKSATNLSAGIVMAVLISSPLLFYLRTIEGGQLLIYYNCYCSSGLSRPRHMPKATINNECGLPMCTVAWPEPGCSHKHTQKNEFSAVDYSATLTNRCNIAQTKEMMKSVNCRT